MKLMVKFILVGIFCTLIPTYADAASLPPQFLDMVVALGSEQQVQLPQQDGSLKTVSQWATEGTGFLYGSLVKEDPDPTHQQYQVFLVTAKHVVEGHKTINPSNIFVRINQRAESSGAREFDIPLSGSTGWYYPNDVNVDLAILPIDFGTVTKQFNLNLGFFQDKMHAANKSKMREIGTSAGDSVYVLGFPMSMAGLSKNYAIVRSGIISRLSELMEEKANTFLIDSFVFPGNSGGPVILKPDIMAIQGTRSNNSAYLIGMVLAYRPYDDIAMSIQTKKPRVIFEENSGLAEVLPVDEIDATISAWRDSHGITNENARSPEQSK